MTTALERSHAPDANARYAAVLELANEPGPEAAARLVALLEDDAEVCVDEGCAAYDVDPTYRPLSGVAREALYRMGPFLWPAVAAAWSASSLGARRSMIAALAAQSLEARAHLPDEAHALLEDEARSVGAAQAIAIAVWERAFAARARRGELSDPEAFWRAAHDHPSPTERDRSFVRLATVVSDPVALARELLALLPRKDVWTNHILSALVALPAVMPADVVEAMISSPVVREHPETWPWLARHGDPARALVPLCVGALTQRLVGRSMPMTIASDLDERRWRLAAQTLQAFAPIPDDVRATLLDRLATIDETMSLQGSLRRWLCELLGDPAAIETALAPRLEEMDRSEDPVVQERARQLRHRLQASRAR